MASPQRNQQQDEDDRCEKEKIFHVAGVAVGPHEERDADGEQNQNTDDFFCFCGAVNHRQGAVIVYRIGGEGGQIFDDVHGEQQQKKEDGVIENDVREILIIEEEREKREDHQHDRIQVVEPDKFVDFV